MRVLLGALNYKSIVQIATVAACGLYLLIVSFTFDSGATDELLDLENTGVTIPGLTDLNRKYWLQDFDAIACRSFKPSSEVFDQGLALQTSAGPVFIYQCNAYLNQ